MDKPKPLRPPVRAKTTHAMGLSPGALDPLEAAKVMGSRGGSRQSEAQMEASRANLKRGGAPGRGKVTRFCQKCGIKCESWKLAQEHCKSKKGKD
jgi:hypothetical protein